MSNLDKLKKMKEANKAKEDAISQSFSIAEAEEQAPGIKESSAKDVVLDEKPKNKPEKDKAPIKPIKENKPIKSIEQLENSAGEEKNLGLRFASEEDKTYLNLAPARDGISKKAFFIALMEQAIQNESPVDFSDNTYCKFRDTSLNTSAVTIQVPVSLIDGIKKASSRHLMKYQRYVAWVVYQARINDPDWTL